MEGTEWALILFTLLIQAGVGVFLIAEITAGALARIAGENPIQFKHLNPSFLSLALIAAGIGLSFFHLGSPESAYHALNNWQSSWLSREILFVMIFSVLLAVLSLLRWKKVLNASMRRLVVLMACASGLILIFSMSKLYMLPTVPPWNNLGTPVIFYISTALLGCQVFGLCYYSGIYRLHRLPREIKDIFSDWSQKTFGRLILLSVILVVLQLYLVFQSYARFLSPGHAFAVGAPDQDLNFQLGFVIRPALLVVAIFLSVFLLFRLRKSGADWPSLSFLTNGAFCLILISEILGRYLFFAAYYRLGL